MLELQPMGCPGHWRLSDFAVSRKARWEGREGRRVEMVSEVLGVGVCLLSPISMTTSPPTHPSPLLIGRT